MTFSAQWRTNRTWQAGVFSELPFHSWRDHSGPLSADCWVFERQLLDDAFAPGNMRLLYRLTPNTKVPWGHEAHMACIKVDRQAKQLSLDNKTEIGYRIVDSISAIQIIDPIGCLQDRLQTEIEKLMQSTTKPISHEQLELLVLNMPMNDLGIALLWMTIPPASLPALPPTVDVEDAVQTPSEVRGDVPMTMLLSPSPAIKPLGLEPQLPSPSTSPLQPVNLSKWTLIRVLKIILVVMLFFLFACMLLGVVVFYSLSK